MENKANDLTNIEKNDTIDNVQSQSTEGDKKMYSKEEEMIKAKKALKEAEGSSDDSKIVRDIIEALDIRMFADNIELLYFWNEKLKIYSPMLDVEAYKEAILLALTKINRPNLKNKKRVDALIYLLQPQVVIMRRFIEMTKREIIAFNGFHGCDDVHYLEFDLNGKIEILEPSKHLRVLRHYDWTLNSKNIYKENGKSYYMPKCTPTGLFKTNFIDFLPTETGYRETIQEYLGDTLRLGSSQVAPVFKGPGQNLKGVIIDILLNIHGKNAFAYDLSSNTNFNNAKMLGKFLAICDEVKAKINDDDYKKMNGQTFLNIDRKHLNSLNYKFLGKMIVALNRMFTTKDQGFSLERRVTIFNLDRIVPANMALDDFSYKMLNGGKYKDYYGEIKDNGNGQRGEIIDWILEGCARVCGRGKVLKDEALPACLRDTKKEVMNQMMPIKDFFSQYKIEAVEKGSTTKEEVWTLWKDFCFLNGFTGVGNAQTFAQDFKQRFETENGNGTLKYTKKEGKNAYKIKITAIHDIKEESEEEVKVSKEEVKKMENTFTAEAQEEECDIVKIEVEQPKVEEVKKKTLEEEIKDEPVMTFDFDFGEELKKELIEEAKKEVKKEQYTKYDDRIKELEELIKNEKDVKENNKLIHERNTLIANKNMAKI